MTAAAGAALPSNNGADQVYVPVLEAIQQWCDNPEDSQVDKRVQQTALEFLLSQEDDHWFCSENGPTCHDKAYKDALFTIATFNVRLVGFKVANKVQIWRSHLEDLLQRCHHCVKGWIIAQEKVGPLYLRRKWPDKAVSQWYQSLHLREHERVKSVLSKLEETGTATPLSTPVLYNILQDVELHLSDDLIAIVQSRLPEVNTFAKAFSETCTLPSGLLYNLIASNDASRSWAIKVLSKTPAPSVIAYEGKMADTVVSVLNLVSVLDGLDSADSNGSASRSVPVDVTKDTRLFWHGVVRLLEWLPEAFYAKHLSGGKGKVDVVKLVTGHLGDRGNHWLEVIHAFRIILERLDIDTWRTVDQVDQAQDRKPVSSEVDAGYAGARLHDALDNPNFLREIRGSLDASSSEQTFLEEALFGWVYYFLRSLRQSHFLAPCFSIICSRLLDEYGQKDLYEQKVRLRTLKATFKVFIVIFKEASASDTSITGDWASWQISMQDIERRSALIVQTALYQPSEDNTNVLASKAAKSALAFVHTMATINSRLLRDFVFKLADYRNRLSKSDTSVSQPAPIVICESMFAQSQAAMSERVNTAAIAGFVKALSLSSHIPRLSSRSWSFKDAATFDKQLKSRIKHANEDYEKFHKPVCAMMRALADEEPGVIRNFLQLDSVAESIVALIMSPVELIATQAQSVVRQAYDVSSRVDCFRVLLSDFPSGSLRGIVQSLKTFSECASRLPEACAQATRLVRCLTDAITVLCDPSEVLIRNEKWVETHGVQKVLSKMWNMMCTNIALIFEKTEHWAPAFENQEMTFWMRDALIFLREMLEEIRTFEAAATGTSFTSDQPTPRKMSARGRQMLEALNEPLSKMTAWLRLTDRDLLEQTTTATVQVLERFAKARVPVHPDAVKRIRKLAEKMKDPKARKDQLLKPEQVQALVGALARHPEYAKDIGQFAPASSAAARELAWGALSKAKRRTDDNAIEILSDSDDANILAKKGSTRGQGKLPSAEMKVKSGSMQKPINPLTTSKSQVLPKVTSKAVGMIKTAPTRMKNAIYSHAAMRAARDGTSSEEDSDEDDVRIGGLAGFEQAQKGPSTSSRSTKTVQTQEQLEQRKAKMLDLATNTVSDPSRPRRRGERILTAAEAAVQSQNKARLRYNPDYSDLHRQILQWDIQQGGPTPFAAFRYPHSIPQSFPDADAYIDTFLPLLLLECWNEILTAREEIQTKESEIEPFTGRMTGRVSVDDFTEIFLAVDRLGDRNSVSENDIVLLTGPCEAIGKIHQVIKKQKAMDVVIRCHLGRDNGTINRCLVNNTQWTVHKLFSLSTVHREFAGLMSLPYYDLLDEILQPTHHDRAAIDNSLVDRAMQAYRTNRPQAEAILSAMASTGFSLIQGPPGTGKTKTILGLVGAFVSSRGRQATSIGVGSASSHHLPAEKLLLCAPSNAAVDEVAKRLKDGVYNADGRKFTPKVVRIGAESAVNASVQDIFLDTLVEKALGGTSGKTAAGEAQANLATARTNMQALKAERDEKRAEKANIANSTSLLSKLNAEISSLTQRINDLGDQLDRERDRLTQSNRAMETAKRKARAEILSEADVICATLSGSGHDYLAPFDFETVIIDEAAQSVEISSLIPLRYNCRRCIMVGDPNQLPPTVKSREASKAGYNKSLFVRLHAAAPSATHLLSIQYRMHPHISAFPSKAFYESRLSDGPDMASVTKQPWHETSQLFPPYAFLDVRNSREEKGRHHSLLNRQEASVAVALYARLLQVCQSIDLSYRVGVVTAYKAQVGELRKQFRSRFGQDILTKVDFNTVDGFQGQEKDIIILSCVRGGTGEGGGIGFLSDVRRMNVALTRARSSLFVLGDAKSLESNEHWGKLVEDARNRGLLRQVDPSSFALTAIAPTSANAKVNQARSPGRNKRKQNDNAKHTILPAPEGLMRPEELAKSTSGLANGDVKPVTGVKKRLLQDLKAENDTTQGDTKRSKMTDDASGNNASNGNASKAFQPARVKKEESPEEGELMEGIEYTNVKQEEEPAAILSKPSQVRMSNGGVGARKNKPAGTAGVPIRAPSSVEAPARPTPTLVVPRKPGGSMFIPRKPLPKKPGGR